MKKIAAILLCTFFFGGVLSGCSNSNTDPQTETTVQTEPTETTTQTEQTDTLPPTEEETANSTESSTSSEISTGTFDWDTAMSQATFNGKAIPMPFTVNDLGGEYYVDCMGDDTFTNDGCSGGLYSNDGDIMGVLEFYHVLTEDYTDDCPVGLIGELKGLSIQGIQADTPMEQVYATWGEPDKRTSSACYYNCPDKRIILYYHGDRVSSMVVDFEFQVPEESE